MGNLSHLLNGQDTTSLLAQMQSKLKRADDTIGSMSEMLEEKLSASNKELTQSLTGLVEQNVVRSVNSSIAASNKSNGAVLKSLQQISDDIQNIPTAEVPKPVDLSPALKKIEGILDRKLNNRIVEFDVIRDPMSGLIQKIVITEGSV